MLGLERASWLAVCCFDQVVVGLLQRPHQRFCGAVAHGQRADGDFPGSVVGEATQKRPRASRVASDSFAHFFFAVFGQTPQRCRLACPQPSTCETTEPPRSVPYSHSSGRRSCCADPSLWPLPERQAPLSIIQVVVRVVLAVHAAAAGPTRLMYN